MTPRETIRRAYGHIPALALLANPQIPSDVLLAGNRIDGMQSHGHVQKIRLAVFGAPRLIAPDGASVPVIGRKGLAILVFLSRSKGKSAHRDKLADMLWADRDGDLARNSLRQTLTVLRRELCSDVPDLIRADRDSLSLNSDVVASDAEQFQHLVTSASDSGLRAAIELYSAPFLDGFSSGSTEFDRWAEIERDRLHGMATEAKATLARRIGGDEGLALARDLLAGDETSEGTHRLLMELHARSGQRDRALRQYQICRDMLRREFRIDPSPETEALRLEIAHSLPHEGSRGPVMPERPAPAPREPVSGPGVMVLDFVNLGGDGVRDPFASGLVDDIITALLHQREIVVLTERGNPADTLAGRTDPERMPGPKARYVLSGSIQTSAHRVRINAQLIDVVAGTHLWAERYDGSTEDLLDFQENVAHSIALAVRIDLLLTSWKVRDRTPPDEPAVRIIVQRAFVKYFEMTRESLDTAIALAEQALQLSPGSVRAMRTLSLAISASMSQGGLPKTVENTDRALALARQTVAAVPDDEIARVCLSWALSNKGMHAEAVAELHHATNLNPNYPTPFADLAEQYAYLGRSAEAIAAAQKAFSLSSHDPIDFWRHYSVVVAQFAAGEDQSALDGARQILRAKPGFIRAGLFWAAAAAATGEIDEASRAVSFCLTAQPDLRLSNVAPGFMPRYVQDVHHERFLAMLKRAGMPD